MISNCISKRERCLRLSSLQCLVTYFYWMRNGAQVQAEIRASIYLRGLDFWRKCSRYNAAALLELDLWSEPTPTFRRWWFHFYHIWLCLKMRDLLKIAMLMDTMNSQQLSTTLNNSYFVFSMWSVFFTMLINYLLSILYKWGIPIFQLWLYIPISWQCFFLNTPPGGPNHYHVLPCGCGRGLLRLHSAGDQTSGLDRGPQVFVI